jgi:hypothetical protein
MEIIQDVSPRSRFLSWYGACLSTDLREIFEGGVPVKKLITLVVCVFFILNTAQVSDALTYKFEENILGVPFQATMEINVSKNVLKINFDNISPESYGPTIWGFGVGLKNFYEIISGGLNKEFTAGGKDVTKNWSKPGFPEYPFYFSANSDRNDSLFNPKSKQFDSGSNSSTPATFVITFLGGDPVLDESIMPIIRIGGSAFSSSNAPLITKGNLVATPEPSTLLLMGIGLIGIAIVMREML